MDEASERSTSPAESFESPLDFPHLVKAASESMKISGFQKVRKNREERKLKSFVFSSSGSSCDRHALANPKSPCPCSLIALDSPPVSSVTSSTKESEPSFKTKNPFFLPDKNSKKTLSEMLPILEYWARRGLDKAFNTPFEKSWLEIVTEFEKDIECGRRVMDKILYRVYALIQASYHMPDLDSIPDLERKSPFLVSYREASMRVCCTIENMSLEISQECKKLKLICAGASENKIDELNCIEKEGSPNIVIGNAYALMNEKMVLLHKYIEEFREEIRALVSEIEEHL